ncbi:MAG: hypothetical protein Q8N23_23750 [Archangium sp.]|nr:hypothetical protein [Archangium sp.]MDP3569744.1 hypothetical protein [Archangium sp.]
MAHMAVADHEARVSCFFVSWRLAQVMVAIPEIKAADLIGLLGTRYGTPGRVTNWNLVWHTQETVVSAEWGVVGGKISYVSKVLKDDLEASVELWRSRRAKDL